MKTLLQASGDNESPDQSDQDLHYPLIEPLGTIEQNKVLSPVVQN